MKKKYIQLLLSVNFCTAAIGFAHPGDLMDDDFVLVSSEALMETTLSDLFDQIWDNLDKVYPSEVLQRLISERQTAEFLPHNDEIPMQEIESALRNLMLQISNCSVSILKDFYESKDETMLEEREALLLAVMDDIDKIHKIYQPSLFSKTEKLLLKDKLEELKVFCENLHLEILKNNADNSSEKTDDDEFVSPERMAILKRLNEIQDLMESFKEENARIFATYKNPIDNKEIENEDFLTSPQITKSALLYINKNEGFIEINHQENGNDLYTTTWKIRPGDAALIQNWNEHDVVTISKTSILSKYSIYGEKLDYTLSNGKASVRANLVCRSTKDNTYTLLGIDYEDKIVILNRGLILFGTKDATFEGWHDDDCIVLQKSDPSLNKGDFHRLFNKTRNKEIWISTKRQSDT